jgi:hypothetical protein
LPAGDYEAFFTSGNDNGTGDNSNCFFSISDGTSYLPPEIYHNFGGTGARWTSSYIAHFSYNNTQTREFYIVARNHSGSHGCKLYFGDGVSVGGPIQLGLRPLSQSLPAPNLVGSVTSLSAGSLRIESVSAGGATITSNCASNPCTLYNPSSNWVSSVGRPSVGNISLNILQGVFSSPPQCFVQPGVTGGNAIVENNGNKTATLQTFWVYDLSGALRDANYDIICIGPRGSL